MDSGALGKGERGDVVVFLLFVRWNADKGLEFSWDL